MRRIHAATWRTARGRIVWGVSTNGRIAARVARAHRGQYLSMPRRVDVPWTLDAFKAHADIVTDYRRIAR